MGSDLCDAPQRAFPAVAEMADLDALGAVGGGDAAQLVGQALRRFRPSTAIRDDLVVKQVVELAGGALPVPRRDALLEILVEYLRDGIALQVLPRV